ncbi:SLC13 family permease [Benzoatithermus flavus]|uniref:SLC13 family permease n=1 Tax=Benzoatithermus flavus TaxID=3108223 RepID=A0ABU8XP63_9PROT
MAVTFASGFFSAFLVNDAVCLVLTPLVLDLVLRLRRDPVPYLLAVAMASTLAGNLTIPGSVANLIVVQRAAARGIVIGFVEHLAVGAPLTVLTILFGSWWLA